MNSLVSFKLMLVLLLCFIPNVRAQETKDLVGYWQSQNGGSIIQVSPMTGSPLIGEIVKTTPKDKQRGYNVADKVFTKFALSGREVKFDLTVRVKDPVLGKICPAVKVAYSAKLDANFMDMTGAFSDGEFQTINDNKGKALICRFNKLPGQNTANYKRVYLKVPKVTGVKFTRLIPEVELSDLVPLQYFRAVATLDQSPLPNHAEAATLTNKRTGKSIKVTLKKYGENNQIASPMILAGLPDTVNPAPQLESCPGDQLIFKVGGMSKSIKIIEGDDTFDIPPCKALPLPPEYTLTAVGGTTRVYNPASGSPGKALKVQLKEQAGNSVEGEEIIWRSKETGEAYVTATDENGLAQLDFTLKNRGNFYAVAEGLPVGLGFSDKKMNQTGSQNRFYEFDVAPRDALIALGIQNDPPTFKVEFMRPNIIEVWFRSQSVVTSLLYDERFFVRIRPGRYISRRTKPVEVRLTAAGGDVLVVKAKRTTAGVFETTIPIHASSASNHSDNKIAVQRQRGYIKIEVLDAHVRVPVYPTKWNRKYHEAIAQLGLVEDLLTMASSAPGLSSRQKSDLAVKMGLVGAANRWMSERRLSEKYKVTLINTYLGLVTVDTGDLGGKINTDVVSAAKDYRARAGGKSPLPINLRLGAVPRVHFTYETERDKVIDAFIITRDGNFQAVGNILNQLFDINAAKVLNGIKQGLISPGLGAYTAITGWTIEGEVATSHQQIVGGVEGLVGLVSIGVTTLKIASLARSSNAFMRRVVSGRAKGKKLDFSSPNATSGLTIAEDIADDAVDITKRQKRTLKKYQARVDRADAKIEALKSKHGGELTDRKFFISDLEKMEGEVKIRVSQGKTRNKTRLKKIEIQKRKIARLDKRVKGLDKQIAKKIAIKASAIEALGQKAYMGLSKAEIIAFIEKKQLPRAWDRIDGKHIHRLYEDYVTGKLGPEYSKGKGIVLNSSHPGVLGKKMGQPLKSPMRQKRTKRPIMDHINEATGDVADSKYYDFAGKKRQLSPEKYAEYKKKAAREIAETVEKGRMVQRELIRKKRRAKRPPLPELDDEGKQNFVNQVVYQRQVTIITPGKMPTDVEAMIKLLVGKKSAKSLRFRVIKPDLIGWAEKSRF